MKILFLSQRFLLPMDTGGKIRTGNILKQLTKTNVITLISNIESPKDDPYLPEIQKLCTKFIPVQWREIKKYSILFFIRLFLQMFSIYPVNALNDYSSKLQAAVVKEFRSGKYDVAICDFVQSALMFKRINKIPKILFQHNVESVILERHYRKANSILTKSLWWLQWKKMIRYEKKMSRVFDTVIAVSEKDKETFQKLYNLNNVSAIPTGVDVKYFEPDSAAYQEDNSLVFCGSMDWLANEDAVMFFIKDILPEIRRKNRDVKLTVVGRNPSPQLIRLVNNYPEIELTGWVEDIRPYILKSSLYIVPIRIGGGTRMKIFEAMSMGKTVISTSIGAEGLPVVDEENIVLEDNPQKFADKIIDYLKNRQKRDSIGFAACVFVRKYFSWEHITDKFSDICHKTARTFK
jgi:glycosyltransferase involved in cell wall biosynthesis